MSLGNQELYNESLYESINGENAASVSRSVLAQGPEILGPKTYIGFWGNNDLSLGEERGNY